MQHNELLDRGLHRGLPLIKQLLKLQEKFVADDNFFLYSFSFSEKTSLDISCKSSAWQTIYMKCQDLFSLKNKTKKN